MAVLRLPLRPSLPSYRMRVSLDGRAYVLDLRWSGREERWYLDLRDGAGALLAGSIKLVVGLPLLRRFGGRADLPPGELMVVDGRATPADPGLDELGESVQLVYFDAAELPSRDESTTVAVNDLPLFPVDG